MGRLNQSNLYRRVVLLSLAILLGVAAQLPAIINVRVAEYDEAAYLNIARNLRRTGKPIRSFGGVELYDDHAPAYLLLLSLNSGDSPTTDILFARLVTAFFGIGSICLTFLIGERISDVWAGFVAAVLLAVNPFFAFYSFFVRMEVPMVFMSLLGLFWLIESERKAQPGLTFIAGLALAAAVLLREFAVLFGVYWSTSLLFTRWYKNRLYLSAMAGLPVVAAFIGWIGWLWYLSPDHLQKLLQRWASSTFASKLSDPRMLISHEQWGQQIVQDLLGVAVVAALAIVTVHLLLLRKNTRREGFLFLGYLGLAIGISFFVQLKELRHIIEVIPVVTLLIGTSVDWSAIWRWGQSYWTRGSALALGAGLFLFFASPLRLPLNEVSHPSAWLDPLYAHRVVYNDSYYNILRLAGIYVQEHTKPEDIITVAHEGPVVAYYADRHYNMLYTLPLESILQTLEQTDYLVWDHTLFLHLTDEQTQAVQDYVREHFKVETTIQDDYRQVTIYRRAVTSN
jgi:predicted membrane-bound mannosyltransferase